MPTQKKNCNRCKAAVKTPGGDYVCGLGYLRDKQDGHPLEPCPKPLNDAALKQAKLTLPEEKAITRYLIDSENTGRTWFPVVSKQREQSIYYLFYTTMSPTIPMTEFEDMAAMYNNGSLRLVQCECGTPNALDFQLVCMAGQMLDQYPADRLVIVSRDSGYDILSKWDKTHGRIKRVTPEQLVPEHVNEVTSEPKKVMKPVQPLPAAGNPAPSSGSGELVPISTQISQAVNWFRQMGFEKKYQEPAGRAMVFARLNYSISERLREFHNSLVTIAGEKGENFYRKNLNRITKQLMK